MNALVRRLRNFFGFPPQLISSSVPCAVKEVHQAPEQTVEQAPPLAKAKEQAIPTMASLSSRAAVMIRPHVPLIRFRYAKDLKHVSRSSPGTTQRTQSTEISQERGKSSLSSIAQDELPARYRRRQMSQEEMDSINTGGVAAEPVKPAAGKPKSR